MVTSSHVDLAGETFLCIVLVFSDYPLFTPSITGSQRWLLTVVAVMSYFTYRLIVAFVNAEGLKDSRLESFIVPHGQIYNLNEVIMFVGKII